MNATTRRVLVTDADSTKALAIVRALGSTMEIWTASHSRFGLAAWSRYATRHLVYSFDSPADFAQWVLDSCKKHGITVVICPEEQTSFLLSRDKALFQAQGVVLTTPPFDALKIAMDKASTITIARQIGVPVPHTKTLQDLREAIPAAQELGYPLVVKPRFSHYWNGRRFLSTDGVRYANSDAELTKALRGWPEEMPPPLLQEFIPGRGSGVSLMVGHGDSVCAEFAHDRLRDFRPTGSGSVLRRSVAVDPQLRHWSLDLLRHLEWWGVAMVEFRTDSRNAAAYLMEINGRFWGSLQLATDAGVNFPEILVDVALGEPVKTPEYREGVLVRWWLGDLIRALRVLRGRPVGFRGSFPARLSGLVHFLGRQPRGTRNEVLRRSDPWPAVGEIFSLPRRALPSRDSI